MGEYAAQSVGVVSVKNKNNLECALAEAAYLTGLERNADVVRMASYAPLFANTEAWQWTPDMIWVNSLQVYATPNYYVQQLYSRNRGDVVLPAQLTGVEKAANGVEDFYASVTRDEGAGEIIIKAVNPGGAAREVQIKLDGVSGVNPQAQEIVLTGGNLQEENSMASPRALAPVESNFSVAGTTFTHSFQPHSMTVLRIKTK
jgi:alpha-N-arabinofuranosidase